MTRGRLTPEERIRRRVLRRRHQADANAKRRANFYTQAVEDVRREEIARRDNHTCHICGKWVSVHEASLDHVVPLAKGGEHTHSNIRLAHKVCNSKKGDRLTSEIDAQEF